MYLKRIWWLSIFTVFCSTLAYATTDFWSEGTVAVGQVNVLTAPDPIPIVLPNFVAEKIEQRTAILYFSPTCPHCQAVIPEINDLNATFEEVKWLGVASANSSPDAIAEFVKIYEVEFPIVLDSEGIFQQYVGARATPNVYLVDPDPNEAAKTENTDETPMLVVDLYLPYGRGMSGIFQIRSSQDSNPFAHFDGYQGTRTCVSCHIEEGRSWYLTHHAQAYYTLYKKEQTDDPKCVSCHVVGLGEEKGFVMGDHNSPMVGVGCESCHGAGGGHKGEGLDAMAQCVKCHDDEHSIQFSVEKGLPHIDHFAANYLSDEELNARVKAIAEGTAQKPLLNFPEGETVGSDVCVSCHQKSHPNDPHAQAMKTLNRKQRQKDNCLQCHATPKKVENLATKEWNLESVHAKDGVGCESCHGVGTEHVANPSKENIVGLGESCPVCVLESMCTSCHNAKWDADWDLDARLKTLKKW